MPISAIRPSLTLLTAFIALLAAGWAVALADEATEPVDPAVVTLEPGENLVGWLGEELPVDSLKRRFPAIESVAAWEPLSGRFYEPTSLLAGQGYVLTLSGTESVEWRRPMTPVKGKITLHRGRNLVTWLGPDDWTIDRVALGIGRSLVRAQWDGGEYSPADATTSELLPTLKRGTALWVEVSRTVNWLQPAGMMPPIVFAGEISADIEATIRRDSDDIMNWFVEEYGVQPDGSILTLYIATDPESLVEALERDGYDTANTRYTWHKSEGWASAAGYVVQKAEQWQSDHRNNRGDAYGGYTFGRRVLAHEYYHTIQQQMSNTDIAEWLVEGDAQWARARFVLRDTEGVKDELSEDRREISTDVPPLRQIEIKSEDGGWEYGIGTVASHQLALRSGQRSLLEFWRALLPEPLGPLGRWQTHPPWQDTFEDVFGISVEDFYDEFAAWRSSLAPVSIRGRVVGPDGIGLPYVKITARSEHLLEQDRHHYFKTLTDANGEFELRSARGGGVQWGVDLGGCEVYYASGGAAYKWEHAEVVLSLASDQEQISVALTEDTCVWRISGVLVDAKGKPLAMSVFWVNLSQRGLETAQIRTACLK